MRRWLSIVGLVVLGLSGCASMSKDECLNADWELIGYEDGANGQPPTRIGEHRKACADHGVTPNRTAYDHGYQEGVLTFCSYDFGYRTAQFGQLGNL